MSLWKHVENFETVIWDWNGTLLDDYEAAWKAECRLFEKLGRKFIEVEERKRLFTMPVQLYYERVGLDFSVHSFEQLSNEWFDYYVEEMKNVGLFQGAEDVLGQIVKAGKKQFILSAAPEKHLHEYAHEKNLKQFFNGIYGLKSNTADCKRERGRDLFKDHSLNPQTTLIIGDMVHDAEVAETLGCHVLLVADGHQHYDVLLEKTPSVLRTRY